MDKRLCYLVLESGEVFAGRGLGRPGKIIGELAVNTAMTGYAESLSDPSYCGQILVFTYPQIGNYGVSGLELESLKIQVAGLVVAEGHNAGSHHQSHLDLDGWLDEQGIVAISGVDTRRLIKCLRGRGALWGRISEEDTPFAFVDGIRPPVCSLNDVSIKGMMSHGLGSVRIALVDCGVKRSIITELLKRDVTVLQVPVDTDFTQLEADGWLLSNGPGDPRNFPDLVSRVRSLLDEDRPILGICLGHQLLALAAGAKVLAMPFGHRGHNQPVREINSEKAFITSQNHGYAVDGTLLPQGWLPWFDNLNDGSNEGIRHETKPFCSVQFHPEAAGGPRDTGFLFDQFVEQVKASALTRGKL